jgi:hypothetical protein
VRTLTDTTLQHAGQATVLFRAALSAEPKNFCAANELAVVLPTTGN